MKSKRLGSSASASSSEFLFTLADLSQFPNLFHGPYLKGHREPRLAMVGRSNVGKSTLINALLGARLAQTSHQPGKTRAIYFYLWKKIHKIIVDLPGYGYAKVSASERQRWEKLIDAYLQKEQNLERVLLLLDARHGPLPADQEAIQFLSLRGIPVTFVITKADALKTQSERALRRREVTEALQSFGLQAEKETFWISSHQKIGLKPLISSLCGERISGG